ncbi:hypothetical protein KCV06_g673, partial [Aureobasidium melanogenum]
MCTSVSSAWAPMEIAPAKAARVFSGYLAFQFLQLFVCQINAPFRAMISRLRQLEEYLIAHSKEYTDDGNETGRPCQKPIIALSYLRYNFHTTCTFGRDESLLRQGGLSRHKASRATWLSLTDTPFRQFTVHTDNMASSRKQTRMLPRQVRYIVVARAVFVLGLTNTSWYETH